MPTDFKAIADAISNLGGLALLALFVAVAAVGLYRSWWVPGWIYQDERKKRLASEGQERRTARRLQTVLRVVGDDPRLRAFVELWTDPPDEEA